MWQYTSSGKIDGIRGSVDLNYIYDLLISKNYKTNDKINVIYTVYDNKTEASFLT